MSKQHKQLRVGVVGLGMGRNHIRQFNEHPRAQVVAVCDPDASRLEEHGEGVEQRYAEAQAMFAQAGLDVVSIATPNRFHAPLTLAALEAGLHVLCEKPMAMNAAEARQMVDAANRHQRKLAINYSHRQTANVQTMGAYIRQGAIGQPYFARTVWHRRKGIPGRASFVSRQNAGGGCLIDLGVHIIDIALFLLGFPAVKSVSGKTYTKFDQKDVPHLEMDVDDFATAYVRCANDITLAIEVSWASHHEHPEQMLTAVYGTEGGLTRRVEFYQDPQIALHQREHGNLVTTTIDKFNIKAPSPAYDLIDAVLEDRDPQPSGDHGLALMQILDALYESSETGREVVITD